MKQLRTARVETKTKETKIRVWVNLDGSGKGRVSTGVKFLDHMLQSFSTHSMIDVDINATGDLKHHIIEDTALALGKCIAKALGDRTGITRFGFAYIPMDEALGSAFVDLVKRPYFVCSDLDLKRNYIEDLPREDLEHFLRSFCNALECTIHIRLEYGSNDHHKVEACFKSLALALRIAAAVDQRRKGSKSIPSSKGAM